MTDGASRRVLMVTSSLPRWEGDSAAPFVLHLAQDLTDLGWNVQLLAPHAPGAAHREQLGGVPVERFRYLFPERLETVCYRGGALINLRDQPVNYLKLPALVFSEWVALARRLATGGVDLVHSHWVLPQGLVGVVACRPRHVSHVVTVHGSDVFGLQNPLLNVLKRLAFRGADAVTANSSATELAVRRIAPDLEQLRRIPMGVGIQITAERDPKLIRARYRRGSGPLVVFVGRLVRGKGLGDLIDAFGKVRSMLPDASLMVLGDGQHREVFQKQADSSNLAEWIHFLGWVESADVPAYLRAADVFAGPSRTGRDGSTEAQGLTFGEAMLAGVPVVATGIGGIPDIVSHEETGLLVPEGSSDDLAAAIVRLHQDPALGERMAHNAMKKIKDGRTRSQSALAFSGLFEEVLSRRRTTGGGSAADARTR